MASTLVEMLVRAGLISHEQAARVRQQARDRGEAESSSLLTETDLGEERLARFLGRQLKLAYFDPDGLSELSPVMREFLPVEMALRFRALPLRLGQKGLETLLADPTDHTVLQDLSQFSGYPLVPLVAPACRLLKALCRCYRCELPAPEQQWLRQVRPGIVEPVVVCDEAADEADLEEAQIVEDEPRTPHRQERQRQEAEREAERAEPEDALAAAGSRDEVVEAVMTQLAARYERCALLRVRGDRLQGWRAISRQRPVADFERLELSLLPSAILKSVVAGRRFYLGTIPELPLAQRLGAALGGSPGRVLLLPLELGRRVAAVLYVEGGGRPLRQQIAGLQRLLGRMACALEILILQQKVKDT